MGVLADTFNRYAARANQIVDTSFYRYRESDDWMLQYFPVENLRSWTYVSQFISSQMPIASVIGLDSEIPSIPARVDITEALQDYAKVGISHPWGEREVREYLDALDRRGDEELENFFMSRIFGPVAMLSSSVIDRVKMLTWQLITTLKIEYTDPLSRTQLTLDFTSLGIADNFLDPLSGTDSWDNAENANGLANLREHLRIYRDRTGGYPDEIVMSDSLIYDLLAQDSTRAELMGAIGVAPDNEQLANVNLFTSSLNTLNQYIRSRLVLEGVGPTIRPMNKVYSQLNRNKTITDIPFLDKDTYVFLKRTPATPGQVQQANRMGSMVFGPTVESATAGRPPADVRAIRGRMRPGPYAWAREVKDSPVFDEAVCVANAIPIPKDPRFFGARKVRAAA